MNKTCNGSSVIYGKKAFDVIICYFVIFYYDLDLVLNQVASNELEVAPFWKICTPQCERVCGGPEGQTKKLKYGSKTFDFVLKVSDS